jgi:hypothetical protein
MEKQRLEKCKELAQDHMDTQGKCQDYSQSFFPQNLGFDSL